MPSEGKLIADNRRLRAHWQLQLSANAPVGVKGQGDSESAQNRSVAIYVINNKNRY